MPHLSVPIQTAPGPHLIQWLANKVSAGFPSPAEDFGVSRLDLDRILNIDNDSNFFMRVSGYSMVAYGLNDGDIVSIRKGRRPSNGDIVVASVRGEFLVKMLEINGNKMTLKSGNPAYKDIVLTEEMDAECWGVVAASIRVFPSGVINVRAG